ASGCGEKRRVGELRAPALARYAVEPIHHDSAEDGAELEAVPGAGGGEEDAGQGRVEVEQEVVTVGEGVHAAVEARPIAGRIEAEPIADEPLRLRHEPLRRRTAVEVGVLDRIGDQVPRDLEPHPPGLGGEPVETRGGRRVRREAGSAELLGYAVEVH